MSKKQRASSHLHDAAGIQMLFFYYVMNTLWILQHAEVIPVIQGPSQQECLGMYMLESQSLVWVVRIWD